MGREDKESGAEGSREGIPNRRARSASKDIPCWRYELIGVRSVRLQDAGAEAVGALLLAGRHGPRCVVSAALRVDAMRAVTARDGV